jgi:hypothetical protein
VQRGELIRRTSFRHPGQSAEAAAAVDSEQIVQDKGKSKSQTALSQFFIKLKYSGLADTTFLFFPIAKILFF